MNKNSKKQLYQKYFGIPDSKEHSGFKNGGGVFVTESIYASHFRKAEVSKGKSYSIILHKT